MRVVSRFAAALVAALAVGCGGSNDGGGSSQRRTAPQLDQDYAPSFSGTWDLNMRITVGATSQTGWGQQTVTREGRNAVIFSSGCSPSVGLRAVVTSAGHLDFDPTTCAIPASCGTVTLSYERGSAYLAQGTLTGSLEGTASGCGQTLAYTFSFTGQLQASGSGTALAALPGAVEAGLAAAVAAGAGATAAPRAP